MSSEYELIRARLLSLLVDVKEYLSPQQSEQIEDFIQAAEYGVALEWLVGHLAEAGQPVAADALMEIDDLAEIMELRERIADDRFDVHPKQ